MKLLSSLHMNKTLYYNIINLITYVSIKTFNLFQWTVFLYINTDRYSLFQREWMLHVQNVRIEIQFKIFKLLTFKELKLLLQYSSSLLPCYSKSTIFIFDFLRTLCFQCRAPEAVTCRYSGKSQKSAALNNFTKFTGVLLLRKFWI